MRFGMLYELQLPKPWESNSEQRLVDEAIEQCVRGDKLGIDYAWSVEHHFLEEYRTLTLHNPLFIRTDKPVKASTADRDGFSLNAAVSCQPYQRDQLERL
jgi:alkanesulfonate monooxygenase SsuD/methylene tetrahydromethanopterin reductase-like flavin-dependent oxidoreductase (luciferase family)